jgi:hypothetical protein
VCVGGGGIHYFELMSIIARIVVVQRVPILVFDYDNITRSDNECN